MRWSAFGPTLQVLTSRLCQTQLRVHCFLLFPPPSPSHTINITIIFPYFTAFASSAAYCGLSKFLSTFHITPFSPSSRHMYSARKSRRCDTTLPQRGVRIVSQRSHATLPRWREKIYVLHVQGRVHAAIRNVLVLLALAGRSTSLFCNIECLAHSSLLFFPLPSRSRSSRAFCTNVCA